MSKKCSVVGCEEKHHARGFCHNHYGRIRKLESLSMPENKDSVCTVEGCDVLCHGGGMCSEHFARLKKYGAKSLTKMRVCEVEGCEEKHMAFGLCNKHYARFKRYGTVELPEKKKKCGVEGCMDKYYAKGYCKKHYRQSKTPLGVCIVEGCNKRIERWGKFCKFHAMEEYHKKQTCKILRKHEEYMKDDPESLTPTFMRELVLVDCDDDVGEEDEVD